MGEAHVAAVSTSSAYTFTKIPTTLISLVAGRGVAGDAHYGARARHRSRVRRNPAVANLRQVHLIHAELIDELNRAGFDLRPGAIGENVLTRDLDLLGLPTGTRLHLGSDAVVEVTGLRDPCIQLNTYRPGLMAAVLGRTPEGELVRKAGIMGIVATGGVVRPGDTIRVEMPSEPWQPLGPV